MYQTDHESQRRPFRLEAPSGADALRVRRLGNVRRSAIAGNTEEFRRVAVFVHLARPRRTLPPTVTKCKGVVVREVLRHLALKCLVLAALLANPRTIAPKDSRRSFDDLGVAEQEQPVGRSCHGGVFVRTTAADVVRELPDRVHLGLEIGRHEVPDLAAVHLRAELGPLPAADVGFRGIHAGFDSKRGGEERQARLAGTVGEVVVVDADDAVGQRVPVRERYRPLGARVHGVLRLGIELARVALFPDVLGHGLLVVERPVDDNANGRDDDPAL